MKNQIHARVAHFLRAVEKVLTRLCLGSLTLFAVAIAMAPPMVYADEQAKMADAFVDSIAVNTHFGYGNSPYVTNLNSVITALEVSGIRHLRDGSAASSPSLSTVISRVRTDVGRRMGVNLVTETGCTINTNTVNPAENLNWTGYTNIDSIEGMNELNTYGCSSPPWYAEDKNDLAALYNAVQTNINMSGVYVLGPSLAYYYGSQVNSDAASVGDCTAIMNYGVQHSYPGGQMPSVGILDNLTNLTPMNGNLPVMATETGYNNDTLSHGSYGQVGVSEQAGGKYYSRLYFEYLNAGIVRAYAYELIDDTAFLNYSQDSMGGPEANYGLIHADTSAKPAFTAITNEIKLLNDPGTPFTPGGLNYNLGSVPSYLHHTLMEKRTGTFYLALWLETNSYNTSTFTNNVIASIPVTVSFGSTIATVNQYNPLSSPNAFASNNNVTSVNVSVGDQALILEIIPLISGPPAPPTGLTATAGNASVSLNWELSPGASSYNVYRSTTSGGPYTLIAGGVTGTSYTDTGVVNGTTYYYVVTAVNGFGEGGYSSEASATPCAFSAAPTGLIATGGNGQIALSWTASSGATSYIVKRADSSSGPYGQVASGITGTSYTDTAVSGGTTYYYVVDAVNSCGASDDSAYVGATTIPSAPAGLAALAGNAQVALSWAAPFGAASYNVKRSTTSGGPYTQIASGQTSTSYTDTGLNNGTTYYYVVTAVDASGESPNSSQTSVTPASGPGILFVQAAQNISSTASVSASMANNAGDAILVAVREASAGSGITGSMVTDTAGNQYTFVSASFQGTARGSGFFVATNVAASGNNTITFNWGTSAGLAIVAEEFANVSGVEAFNTNTTTYNPVTSLSSGSITTTNIGDLFAFEVEPASDETWTAGNGYTIPPNGSNTRLAMECFVAGAAGTYSASISNSAPASLDGVFVALTSRTNAPSAPPAPTGLTATGGNTQVILGWNASTGATSYNVYRSTTSGGPYTKIASGVSSTSYTDTGLSNGTTYYYVVTAVNGSGESGYSNQASATPTSGIPPAPTGLTATGGNTQVTLGWNTSTGATSYKVYRSTTNGGPYAVIATNTTTSYTNTGLANGTTYYYVVTAVNGSGESGYSNQASAATIPAPPTGLSATGGNTQVTLGWNASTGATSYKVYRSTTNGGPYAVIATNTTTSYTNTGLANGTTYYYVVTAVNSTGESGYSNQASATPSGSGSTISFVRVAQGVTANNTNVSVTMANNAGDTLVVAIRMGNAGAQVIVPSNVRDTSGNTYTLVNYANQGSGNDRGSAFLVATNVPAASANTITFDTTGDPGYWGPINGQAIVVEEFANVSRVETNGTATTGYTQTATISSGSLTTTNSGDLLVFETDSQGTGSSWTAGSGYTIPANGQNLFQAMEYFVAGAGGAYSTSVTYNSAGGSLDGVYVALAPSTTGSGAPPSPTGLTATGGNAQVALSWNASSGATSYKVYRSTTSGGPYTAIATNATTSYTNTGLANGTTYYYVVTAVNSSGESGYSNQASATTIPAPPTGLSATAGNAQVTLTWNASSGATSYNARRSTTNGGPYTVIATNITTTSYTNTGLANGTTYYYVVSAVNASGESANSSQASATTIPAAPGGLTATAGNAQVTLTWNASSGATSYNARRSTTNGGPYTVIATNITTTSYTNTGLANGTTYYYVVTAVNSTGESGYSNQASATPSGSGSTISFVRVAQGVTANNTNVSVTMANNAGDTLVVAIRMGNAGAQVIVPSNVRDTSGNTYTLVNYANQGSGNDRGSAFLVATNVPAASANTITFDTTGDPGYWGPINGQAIVVEEFANVSRVETNRTATTGYTQTATISSGSLTTTNSGDLLVFETDSQGTGSSWTAGSGYTIPANGQNLYQTMEYYVSSASGAYSTSMTYNSAGGSLDGVYVALTHK